MPSEALAKDFQVSGCPAGGVQKQAGGERRCLMVVTSDGAIYDIISTLKRKPWPKRNYRAISVSGTVTGGQGVCGQGLMLSNVRWDGTYTGKSCRKP